MRCENCNSEKESTKYYFARDITYKHIIGVALVCDECKQEYEYKNNVVLDTTKEDLD